jgi:predicted RNA-binding protein
MQPTYWLDLFTYETWQEFLAAGAKVSGFREARFGTLKQTKPGDILLCYLTGVSRWIGLLEVTGEAYLDSSPIWSKNSFPARVPVKLIAELTSLSGVPVIDMKDKLSIFQNLKNPNAWSGSFRGSLSKWKQSDGEAIVAAIMDAVSHPIERPFDVSKLSKIPPVLKSSTSGGNFTIPENEEPEITTDKNHLESLAVTLNNDISHQTETTAHTEIQWLLVKLGNDMGLDVWVAKNDRNKNYKGIPFSSFSRLKKNLPHQFDQVTTRTIELIDVLWLKGNSIQAAFEVESTTTIYSGLLRMSDLITMQPNLNIPLYIVAPVDRRNKVIEEINRPTFAKLSPPMAEICRFISFDELRKQLQLATNFLKFLKPEFLDSFSESCHVEDI